MKKLIILFSVFICFAITSNGQGVTRTHDCFSIGGDGLSFYGCETLPLVGDLLLCKDEIIVRNKSRVIRTKVGYYVVGAFEIDGEIVPFEQKPMNMTTITPNEKVTIQLSNTIASNYFNAKLVLRIGVSVSIDGETIVSVENMKFECHDYQDD